MASIIVFTLAYLRILQTTLRSNLSPIARRHSEKLTIVPEYLLPVSATLVAVFALDVSFRRIVYPIWE